MFDIAPYIKSINKRNLMNQERMTVKCVIVGDGAVGKTCLLISYAQNRFPRDYIPTIFDNYSVTLNAGGRKINLLLFDTAGQEEYDQIRPLSYADADVFVVCFSVVSRTSLGNVCEKWIPELELHCPGVPFIIVGTQSDKKEDSNIEDDLGLNYEELASYALEIGGTKYIECSALTGDNVQTVFKEAIVTSLQNTSETKPSTKTGQIRYKKKAEERIIPPKTENFQSPKQPETEEVLKINNKAPVSFTQEDTVPTERTKAPPPLPPRRNKPSSQPSINFNTGPDLEENYRRRMEKRSWISRLFGCCS